MKIAKNRCIKDSEVLIFTMFIVTTLLKPNQISIIKKYVFIFDINDILIRDKKVIFEVIETIRLLNK